MICLIAIALEEESESLWGDIVIWGFPCVDFFLRLSQSSSGPAGLLNIIGLDLCW